MLGRLMLLLLVLAPLATSAYALDVSACGTVIPPGETGVLVTDLVCSPTDSGIQMNDRSTLDLAGHTITGGIMGVAGDVQANPRCRIVSSAPGGAIVGSLFGINNCFKTEVSDVAVVGATMQAIGGPRLILTNVTIQDGGEPITTSRLDATNLVITNNHGVMQVNRAVIRGLTATGNIGAPFASGTGTFFIRAFKRLTLMDATVTGNTGVAITGARVTLRDSTVTGNDTTGDGIDLLTTTKPRLIDSTCGRSAELNAFLGASWQVCTGDPP